MITFNYLWQKVVAQCLEFYAVKKPQQSYEVYNVLESDQGFVS